MKEFGFIILRHVAKPGQNRLWINCYRQIRKFYKADIVIIDDNSKQSIVKKIKLINCTIIQSEFPGRGEILPYYYMFKRKLFQKALILHDSAFIIRRIPINKYKKPIQPLWIAKHNWDNAKKEINFIRQTLKKSGQLINFYNNKNAWNLCFGGMTMVRFGFLRKINNKYDFFGLLEVVNKRRNRMAFERILGMIAYKEAPGLRTAGAIFGDIHRDGHRPWKYRIDNFLQDKSNNFKNIPPGKKILKCWVGR